MKKIILPGIGSIAVLVLLVVFHRPVLKACCSFEYQRFNSPDGKYALVVYSLPQFFAWPGSAGDAPGYVELVTAEGRVLKQKYVDMVQIIEYVDWSQTTVDIKLFASWSLENQK